ncbi:hypothetical protein B0O99DRAFT_595343 [Bisporella sp. PMI_857]|nr:hypothetical protein B0O99DRAFT_595343 [Bisporella sp. PMI_857]
MSRPNPIVKTTGPGEKVEFIPSEPVERVQPSIPGEAVEKAQSPVYPASVVLGSPKPTLSIRTKISDRFCKRIPQFSTLPKEIRLIIWEAALPDGRVHELHPCTTLMENGKMMFRSNHSKPPTLLSVCRESRQIALQNYQLMSYEAPTGSKGIRKFYFSPRTDTLFLNTLMGLYMAFMLLETELELDSPLGRGVMKGWQNVALDADRAHLLDLLAGHHGHPPSPRLREVFPDLKKFTIALDFTRKGKTRFRTSVWPGENGTSLQVLAGNPEILDRLLLPIVQFTKMQYGKKGDDMDDGESEGEDEDIPTVEVATVKRKRFLRGDIRYGFRKTCSFLHVRPPGIFMRL